MSETPLGSGISATPCPLDGCACGNIIVRLHDAYGNPLAAVIMPRATAEAFAAQLAQSLQNRTTQAPVSLQLLRCEGTA